MGDENTAGSLKIEKRDVSLLLPYARNPRKNDDSVDAIAASIKEFGFTQPIVINKDGVIVAGHTRLKAAKKLGLKQVPVAIAEHWTEEQAKAYRLLDNKLAEKSSWDSELLSLELNELEFDLSPFDVDFADDVTEPPVEVVEDSVPDEPEIPVTQPGDLWLLGDHRLMCGDSTSAADVARLMDGELSMLLTDPPYGVAYVGKTKDALTIENDSMDEKGTSALWESTLDAWLPHLRPGGAVYATVPPGRLNLLFAAALKARDILRQQLVWVKDSMVLGHSDYHYKHEPILYGWKLGSGHYFTADRTKTSILEHPRPKSSQEHPTMKPISLWAELIQNSSRAGDVLGDPFSGSGTTIIAAEQLGRKCYAMEIAPKYVDVAVQRWQILTGKDAVLERTGEIFEEIRLGPSQI